MGDHDFFTLFEDFRTRFSKERSLIVAINSVNSKTNSDLKQEYSDLINSQCLLTRLHYLANSNKYFELDDISLPLRGIKPINVAASLKVFQKPNHKDRYAYLMFFLREKPDLFSQMLYFNLVSSTTNADDSVFFIFCTFPAIYSYFATYKDQISAIMLLKNLFELHIKIHGSNVSISHSFLSNMVFSFFLSTNPGHFFSVVLKPLLRDFKDNVNDQYLLYKKDGTSLIRIDYWHQCMNFADKMIKRMTACSTLLPEPARHLFYVLSTLNGDTGGFWDYYAFDSLICKYLESDLFSEESDMMKDIVNVIRYSYPAQFWSSSLSLFVPKKHNGSSLSIIPFLEAIQVKSLDVSNSVDSLSNAISICDRVSLFSPRDLNLLYTFTSKYLDVAFRDKNTQLIDILSGIMAPTSTEDNKLVSLKTWLAETTRSGVELIPTKTFDDIIDGLQIVDCSKLLYKNGPELANSALSYCGGLMHWMQRLRIQTNINTITSDVLESAFSSVSENKKSLDGLSESLFSALYFLSTERKRNDTQALRIVNILVLKWFLPVLETKYPRDFDFASNDIFDTPTALQKVANALKKHILTMNLPKAHEIMVAKAFFGKYFDQLDAAFNFQKISVTKNVEFIMTKYVESCTSMIENHLALANKATALFRQVKGSSRPMTNLGLVIDGMKLLKKCKEEEIKLTICQSKNIGLFGFHNFYRKYIREKTIESFMFDAEESYLINMFHEIALKLRSTDK